jgi:hypothetical protein
MVGIAHKTEQDFPCVAVQFSGIAVELIQHISSRLRIVCPVVDLHS